MKTRKPAYLNGLVKLDLVDITDTSRDRSIEVIVKKTNQKAYIPRQIKNQSVQFCPGGVFLPLWLTQRILGEHP